MTVKELRQKEGNPYTEIYDNFGLLMAHSRLNTVSYTRNCAEKKTVDSMVALDYHYDATKSITDFVTVERCLYIFV